MEIKNRYYLASAGMDFALHMFLGAVPFYAMELGAGSLELGIIQALISVSYILIAACSGRLSDKIPRAVLYKLGCVVTIVSWVALPFTGSLGQVYLVMVFLGTGTGLFWPSLQAGLADISPSNQLTRSLGNFNLAWSAGKSLGFLACGITILTLKTLDIAHVYGNMVLKTPFLIAAGIVSVVFIILPGKLTAMDPNTIISAEDVPGERKNNRSFLVAAWLSNFIAFGLAGLLSNQYPRLSIHLGFTEFQFNFFLFTVILFQLVGFGLLMRWTWWQYRKQPLLIIQGAMLVSFIILPFMKSFLLALLTAPFIGLGFSMAYYSSIYYSLHTLAGKGRNAGIHESVLRVGNFFLPLLGGLLVSYMGLKIPYIFGFALGILILVIQLSLLKKY